MQLRSFKHFPILELFLLAFIPVLYWTVVTADTAEYLSFHTAFVFRTDVANVTGLVFTVQAGVRHGELLF